MAVIQFKDLVSTLEKRAAAATTTTKAAAGDTPSVKDPNDKGTVAVPKDPSGAQAAYLTPANSTNVDVTPVTTVSVARTVETKAANAAALVEQAKKVAASIRGLMKNATAAEITPNFPSDKANDNKDTKPTEPANLGPKKKQNPDPEAAKTAAAAAVVSAPAAPAAGAAPLVTNTNTVKSAAEGDPAAKTPGGTPADPEAKKTSMPAADGKGELPKTDATNKDDTGGANKSATAEDLQFTPDFHFKLASSLLSTEQGRAYAQSLIEAEHGAAEADAIIKAATFMEQQFVELQSAEDEGAKVASQLWDNATPEEQAAVIKVANAHFVARESLATEMEKQAYDDGAATAAQLQDTGALQGGPEAGADPAAAGGAADASAGGPPGAAQGGEEISAEDIAQVLQQLVQSGEVKPEEAEAILQELLGGGAGGDAGAPPDASAGGPPADASAGGPPEPPQDAPPEAKAAYTLVKSASAITDQLMAAATAAK